MPTNEEEKGEKEEAVDGGTADTGVDQLRQRLQQQKQQRLVQERTMSCRPTPGTAGRRCFHGAGHALVPLPPV